MITGISMLGQRLAMSLSFPFLSFRSLLVLLSLIHYLRSARAAVVSLLFAEGFIGDGFSITSVGGLGSQSTTYFINDTGFIDTFVEGPNGYVESFDGDTIEKCTADSSRQNMICVQLVNKLGNGYSTDDTFTTGLIMTTGFIDLAAAPQTPASPASPNPTSSKADTSSVSPAGALSAPSQTASLSSSNAIPPQSESGLSTSSGTGLSVSDTAAFTSVIPSETAAPNSRARTGGIIAGSIVVVLCLLALIPGFLYIRRRRLRRLNDSPRTNPSHPQRPVLSRQIVPFTDIIPSVQAEKVPAPTSARTAPLPTPTPTETFVTPITESKIAIGQSFSALDPPSVALSSSRTSSQRDRTESALVEEVRQLRSIVDRWIARERDFPDDGELPPSYQSS